MSRLTQRAPETVPIDGIEYKINTGFRGCLLTIAAIGAKELTQYEKADILLDNMYDEIPPDIVQAIEKAIWFLSGGREPDGKEHPKLCDFDRDADMIYSAMLKKGVDLDAIDMHWWTFLSHYEELPESGFTRVVYLRVQNKRGKLTKEEYKDCDRIGWDVINMKSKDPDMPTDNEIWKYLNSE